MPIYKLAFAKVLGRSWGVALVALATHSLGCSPYGDSCLRNSDCHSGEVCVASACQLEMDDVGDATVVDDVAARPDAAAPAKETSSTELVSMLPDDVKSTDVSAADSGVAPAKDAGSGADDATVVDAQSSGDAGDAALLDVTRGTDSASE